MPIPDGGQTLNAPELGFTDGAFTATEFMCDVEGHPEQPALRLALEELGFFSRRITILGVYPKARKEGLLS